MSLSAILFAVLAAVTAGSALAVVLTTNIVRAATAGDTATAWESALPCRRRPDNRRCLGRMIVRRTQPGAPIHWQCGVCEDDGVISNWEDSPFDLRRRQLAVAGDLTEIVISEQVAATLRDLRLLLTPPLGRPH